LRVATAPCMGRCDTAPTLEIGHNHIDNANEEKVEKAISTKDFHPKIPNYENLKDYSANGGYAELQNLRDGQEHQTKFKMKFLKAVFVAWAVLDFLQEKNGLL